ncbi:uncharacterized protein B0P05DRAFT_175472 [Gilbertella persicaria]|uniref:uncharacterized protein n=1 Tax=Gilbertella persicaria TaxID=101096 RepID=UPI00221F0362|nr:uncharacterized protein B0P05DRAFT_175472 [Gilbertella persicaria]KAI8072151.1 hypothetical protein B0P05DRAFT_175472 [Gilbertella persicaria]
MDAYFQSTLAANSLQPPKTTSSTTPNTTRVIAHFPPTNKDFNCTELHTPDGTYSLLHETFFDTIAPQFATGTRAYVVGVVKEDHVPLDSSEDEGLTFSSVGSLSMTPVVKSAALPIPNARRTLRTTSSSSSSIGNLHILTSPQKIMTANNGPGSPYLPNSPSFMPSTPTQQQQPQQELVNYDSLSSSLTNPVAIANGGSVGSLSSLFGRGNNLYSSNSIGAGVGKSTPQLSSSIARTMSSTNSRPKNHLSKTNSTFVLRFVVHENLQKYLASRAIDDEFLFFNIGSSFIWVDAKTKSKFRTPYLVLCSLNHIRSAMTSMKQHGAMTIWTSLLDSQQATLFGMIHSTANMCG